MLKIVIINVSGLIKTFGDATAINQISFQVEAGEIFGFLGPNGAGKSTTINMLCTLLTPNGGTATIAGHNISTERDAVRRTIGLVFQDPSLDDRLTALENLWFHARLYHVPKSEFASRSREVLELVDLWDRRNTPVRTFSGGMKRRLEIARGLIHYPKVLFLDEPTIGLDPQTRAHLWEYILKLKHDRQMTIFLTTHYMNEAEYCDRIAIIDNGKIVALNTPAALKHSVGGDIITLSSANLKPLEAELNQLYPKKVKRVDSTLKLEIKDGETALPELIKKLKTKVSAIELRRPTLDDVFLSLTGRAIREEGADRKASLRHGMRFRH